MHKLELVVFLFKEDSVLVLDGKAVCNLLKSQQAALLISKILNSPIKAFITEEGLELAHSHYLLTPYCLIRMITTCRLDPALFKAIANLLSKERIVATTRHITLSPWLSNLEGRSDAEKFLHHLLEAPNYAFHINTVELLINANFTHLAYDLACRYSSKMRRQIRKQPKESEEFWEALGSSFESGVSLEFKIDLARRFSPYASTSFVQ